MSADALAKAKEIAARLSGNLTGSKRRWGDEGDAAGLGSTKRKKIYVPTREYPEINFLGLLIGPKGATQKQLQESTGARILLRGKGASKDGSVTHPDDDDELHVAIEGSEDAVERASREVEAILYNPEQALKLKSEQLRTLAEQGGGGAGGSSSSEVYGPGGETSVYGYQVELRVPNNMVGLIIGKGGENILRIQSQLNVNAQIAKEHEMKPGETLRSIIVKGKEDDVLEAKLRIEEIIAQQMQKISGSSLSSNVKDMDTKFMIKLPVPNDRVGLIIGKGGMNVKGIQERTHTTIQIPPVPDEDNPNVRTILIGGDIQDSIYQARDEVMLTVQTHQASVAMQLGASLNPLFVTVPDDKVGIIIGKGGATIKDIQNRLNVRIQIPHNADVGSNPPTRTISIMGPMEFQPVAKYEIEMIAAGTPLHSVSGSSAASWSAPSVAPWSQPAAAYGGGYYDPNSYAASAAAYQQPYGYYGAAAQPAPVPAPAPAPVATDPSAYYNEFWQYALYYGEPAARMYYGAWSPPEGTAPPDGIMLPTPEQAAKNIAAATAGTDAVAVTPQQPAEEKPTTYAASTATTTAAAAAATTEQTAAASESTDENSDPAWEAYKKQYAEWYEAYGKAAGADPNPPRQ